jgi:hypothetical protein
MLSALIVAVSLIACSGHVSSHLFNIDYSYDEDTHQATVTISANLPGVEPQFGTSSITEEVKDPANGNKEKPIATHTTANHMDPGGVVTTVFTLDSNTDYIVVNIHDTFGGQFETTGFNVPAHH